MSDEAIRLAQELKKSRMAGMASAIAAAQRANDMHPSPAALQRLRSDLAELRMRLEQIRAQLK